MDKTISKTILIAFILGSLCICSYSPSWISDENQFLKNFINHEYLSILGVILAITLASLSQLHLSLRKVEKTYGVNLNSVRREIKSSAIYLIVGFVAGLAVIILKPLIAWGTTGEAALNAACLFILLIYILILSDITLSVFDLDVDDD